MDDEIVKQIREEINYLRSISFDDIDFDYMDPIAKMMLVAVLHEGQKLMDGVAAVPRKIIERYCSDFIPYEKVEALPALSVLCPTCKSKVNAEIVTIVSGSSFLYRDKDSKTQLNYLPIFRTLVIPHDDLFQVSHHHILHKGGEYAIHADAKNSLWLGIVTNVEIETLKGMSFYVKGSGGVLPTRISVVAENRNADARELAFATMHEMENLEFLEPFDAQQSSGQFFSFVSKWKETLLNMDDSALFYITDNVEDRDLFKPHPYPRKFQQWLEDESLDRFPANTLWLKLDFPQGYVIPDTLNIQINALPVVNVDINNVTLTQTVPIAKLQKQDNSFFLRVLETSTASYRKGFNMSSDEVIIRDFDASKYHDGDLYRDVRTLYNRFLDDYYAFIEYHSIKDGEVLRRLRETINRLGKGVGKVNDKFRFDSGTYVMRNLSHENLSSSTKVTYMTTHGAAGNIPMEGETMDNRKMPGLNPKVDVIVRAMGGTDKASVDTRYELLRYYALTNDRLYTRMDIEAFLRKEIILAFGKDEAPRIYIRIRIEGAAGVQALQRGLYIAIEFKDRKNYEEAVRLNFDILMQQRITSLSCIAMPIIVTLNNLEG